MSAQTLFKPVSFGQPVQSSSASIYQQPSLDMSVLETFPTKLSPQMTQAAVAQANSFSLQDVNLLDISKLADTAEKGLAKTVSDFLSRCSSESPVVYRLVKELNAEIEKEKVGELAAQVINPQPGTMAKFVGMFSKKKLNNAIDEVINGLSITLRGKTKNLNDVINKMQAELERDQQKQIVSIQEMQKLKAAYQKAFTDFTTDVAFMMLILAKSKKDFQAIEAEGKLDGYELSELKQKLAALESRTIFLSSAMLKLPTDQLVITQLEEAGIITLTESTSTALSRFTNIKMTMLNIHQALVTATLQRNMLQGQALDENLAAVRGQLTGQVALKSAKMMGDNRVREAERLQQTVNDIAALQSEIETARANQQQQFDVAWNTLTSVTQTLGQLGTRIQPGVNRSM
jgi:uncharacterized protein YihD (DUF1040 family)